MELMSPIQQFENELEQKREDIVLEIISQKIEKASEINSIPAMLIEFELIFKEYQHETNNIKNRLYWLVDDKINSLELAPHFVSNIDNKLIDDFIEKYFPNTMYD